MQTRVKKKKQKNERVNAQLASSISNRRRARNRVNAALSRKKRENYIRFLEDKAGVAVTVQGTSARKAAVERSWLGTCALGHLGARVKPPCNFFFHAIMRTIF